MDHIISNSSAVDIISFVAAIASLVVNLAYLVKHRNKWGNARYTAICFFAICLVTTLGGGIAIIMVGESILPVMFRIMEIGGVFGVTGMLMQAIIDY